ncbi:MAG TPA: hypothetical protein VGI40_18595 [Pirellulaceae bacterium]
MIGKINSLKYTISITKRLAPPKSAAIADQLSLRIYGCGFERIGSEVARRLTRSIRQQELI